MGSPNLTNISLISSNEIIINGMAAIEKITSYHNLVENDAYKSKLVFIEKNRKVFELGFEAKAGLLTRLERYLVLVPSVDYFNAGTVEFVVDRDGNYYFIELNARIQVEHPVTEMVTGVDLVKAQIRVAAGEPLPLAQQDIRMDGAAIECRINAEDPAKGFRPNPGRITGLIAPGGPGVRFDSHVHAGYHVSPYYDSMIGKLLVHQPTRLEAIEGMKRALAELRIEGVSTTIPLLREILDHAAFTEGHVDTTFIERTWPS